MDQRGSSHRLKTLDVRHSVFKNRNEIRAVSTAEDNSPIANLSPPEIPRRGETYAGELYMDMRGGTLRNQDVALSSFMRGGNEACENSKKGDTGKAPSAKPRGSVAKAVVPIEMSRMVGSVRKSSTSPTFTEVFDVFEPSFMEQPRFELPADLIVSPSKSEDLLLRPADEKTRSPSLIPLGNPSIEISTIEETSQARNDGDGDALGNCVEETASPLSGVHDNPMYSTHLEAPISYQIDEDENIIEHELTDFDSFSMSSTSPQSPRGPTTPRSPVEAVGTPGMKANRRYYTPVTPESTYNSLGIHRPKPVRNVWVSVFLIFGAAIVTAGILATIVTLAVLHSEPMLHKAKTVDLTDSSVLSDQKGDSIAIQRPYASMLYKDDNENKKSIAFNARAYEIAKEYDDMFYSSSDWELRKFYFYTEVIALKKGNAGEVLADIAVVFKKGAPDNAISNAALLLRETM